MEPNVTPITSETECESCLVADEHVAAVRHSTNPRFSGYALCEECAVHYDEEDED